MPKLYLDTDDNSIDFDFFEAEGNRIKTYNVKNDSSKIITKAVIEAKPKGICKSNETDFVLKNLKLNNVTNKQNPIENMINDCISSPTSSEEKTLLGSSIDDMTLFNCLAFSDDGNDRNNVTGNVEDKYYSDNSLSDSTITTVTSDFTTVSRLSSMSDSSCGFDFSTDSSTSQTGEFIPNDNVEHFSKNTEILDDTELSEKHLEMIDEGNFSDNITFETDNLIESINPEYEHHTDDDDSSEKQENNSLPDKDSDIETDNTDSAKTSTETKSDIIHEKETSHESQECSQCSSPSRKESISTIEERMGDISLASRSSSNSSMVRPHYCRGQNRFRSKRKELNLTFSREELIRIERDNTILLKKIMAYSKPRSVSLNHAFSHKKTSAAINRARQQKKIEQDNYILYSKINAMSRMKKVF